MAVYEKYLHPDQAIAEDGTWYYERILRDKLGAPILAPNLASVTLTLIDLEEIPHAIVNNCQSENILNQGRGSIDGTGKLKVTSIAGDTAILHASRVWERRRARIEWVKTVTNERFWVEVDIMIQPRTLAIP